MDCSMPGLPFLTISWSSLKLMSFELVMPSNHAILCCPLLLLSSIFPSIRVFSVSLLFASGSQSIGASASAAVLPMNIQGWFPLGLTGLISLLYKELSRVFSRTTIRKHQFFGTQPSFMVQLSHPYMTAEKTIALTMWTFVSKVMSLLFNTLSRFAIAFLPRSKCLLSSWLQSPSAVILETKKKKSSPIFYFFPRLFAMKWWDRDQCKELEGKK